MQSNRSATQLASAETSQAEHWSALLHAVLDSTEDGVLVVAPDGGILTYNRRFLEISGLTEQQLAGRTETAVMRGVQQQLQRAASPTELVTELHADPEPGRVDVLPFRDGRIIERFAQPYRIHDAVAGRVWTFRDATRYRHTVAALRESEHRYRLLFEASQSPSYVTSLDGRFVDVNPAAEELFGYTREELLGLDAQALYADPDGRDHFRDAIMSAGSLRDFEVRLRRKDGQVVYCMLSAAVHCDSNGVMIGYQGIIHDISEMKRREASLLHDALHDALTELPHRRFFATKLNRAIERRFMQAHYRFSLLFIDLDNFKLINDTYGHAAGDQLLIAVARRLELLVRPEDTVSRIGGDEFAILLYHVKDASEAGNVAERVRAGLAKPYSLGELELTCTASVGVALWTPEHTSAAAFLADADAAMYRAKNAGANRIEFYPTTRAPQPADDR
jgi:diguanylate cyclase (GGDEF)-like protein/PAS domain S-box-containing protein